MPWEAPSAVNPIHPSHRWFVSEPIPLRIWQSLVKHLEGLTLSMCSRSQQLNVYSWALLTTEAAQYDQRHFERSPVFWLCSRVSNTGDERAAGNYSLYPRPFASGGVLAAKSGNGGSSLKRTVSRYRNCVHSSGSARGKVLPYMLSYVHFLFNLFDQQLEV